MRASPKPVTSRGADRDPAGRRSRRHFAEKVPKDDVEEVRGLAEFAVRVSSRAPRFANRSSARTRTRSESVQRASPPAARTGALPSRIATRASTGGLPAGTSASGSKSAVTAAASAHAHRSRSDAERSLSSLQTSSSGIFCVQRDFESAHKSIEIASRLVRTKLRRPIAIHS